MERRQIMLLNNVKKIWRNITNKFLRENSGEAPNFLFFYQFDVNHALLLNPEQLFNKRFLYEYLKVSNVVVQNFQSLDKSLQSPFAEHLIKLFKSLENAGTTVWKTSLELGISLSFKYSNSE